MIRKIMAVAACLSAIITHAGAQELGIELSGGLQGTQYQLQNGQTKLLPSGSLGLNYTFRLSNRLGLLTGIGAGLYRTQATLKDGVAFTSGQVDDVGSAFQYNVKTVGYTETQQFYGATIPLLLQYHSTGADVRWYLDLGAKALIPFNSSIQVGAQQLILSGYYPDYNLEVSNLPQHGFGTINNWKSTATTNLQAAAVLSAASGVSFKLSAGTRLYTGLYVDYGLTDVKSKNGDMPLVTYSPSGISGVQANSVLNMSIAGQVTSLSYGLQIRLSFGSTETKPAARAKTKTTQGPQQTAKTAITDEEIAVIQKPIVFGGIGEISVPENQKPHLNELAIIMLKYPNLRITIVGHTCICGAETENIKVGQGRASAVASYLRLKGIDASRMDVSAVSETNPVLSYDPAANFQNRRVVITLK